MFDINDDVDKSLFAIIDREYEIPSQTKQASLGTSSDHKVFAYPEAQKYPMDTPNDIYMSYLYFQKTASNLPMYAKEYVEDNIRNYADLCGVSLELKSKQASTDRFVGKKEDFALAIPTWDIRDEYVKQKCANLIHNDYLLMYPINSTENVKLANHYFPKSLEGPLEIFRPKVARAIASRLDPLEYSDTLKDYLPLPKSAALDQLEVRKVTAPEFASKYASLEELLVDCTPENSIKFASALDQLDKQANLFEHYGVIPASQFNRLLYEDNSKPFTMKIASEDVLFEDFKKAGDYVFGNIPNWDSIKDSPTKIASTISQMPTILQEHILSKVANYENHLWENNYLNRNS